MKNTVPKFKKGKSGFRAKQALGQHFISDAQLLASLVRDSNILSEDKVFEIGAGLGSLTEALAQQAKSVLAMEVDAQLMPILRVTLHGMENVQVIEGDIMTANLYDLLSPLGAFKIMGNLPYYITTPILNLLLNLNLPIQSISVMVQKEAAERLVALPSTSSYGPLAVLAQYRAKPQMMQIIHADKFTPPPKCDSALVVMPYRDKPPVDVEEKTFFKLVNASFAMRRKTLLNNLMPSFGLTREKAQECILQADLSPNVRGEALSLQEFARLSNLL
ncbi:MAG: ribosomal RNA small subunit methyltransferase A [Clostridiales bacterium]|nr:ribosomal RNA small subunit methyltransferase A [Clostridiales bacterium]